MKKIPNLKGLEVEEAKDLLRKKSIDFIDETKKIFSLTVGNGKIVKTEEENKKVVLYESNRKLFLFIIIGTIAVTMVLALSITYGAGIYKSIKDQIIEITGQITEPELEAEPGWGKERIVKVKKDAKGSKEIKYYEYCVRKDKNDECDWKETYTKNTVISKTGTWYVTFRGVDKDGKRGKEATVIVYVDNEAPDIKEFKVEKEEETSITVKTISEDKDSGLDKIMYSLDGKNYEEGKEEYTFNNLVSGYEYTLYVKAVDKAGNEKVVSMKLQKKPQEETEEANNPIGEEIENKEKEWDTPQIDLKKLPSVFKYGEKYNLPSRYDFGNDEGKVVCTSDGEEYQDTKTLSVGKHTIKCIATSNHKKEAQIEKEVEVKVIEGMDEIFDGWIRLNLYYPEGTTNWQWRLDGQNGIRTGYDSDSWKDYTGPILIKIADTENVFIRYKYKGETVIIAPRGKVVVDIEPEEWTLDIGKKTKVKINYDENAKTKKYRINGGSWQDYQEEFEVEANTLIEAKATKEEKVYDSDGEYQYTKTITGTDSAYISQYVTPEEKIPANPIISVETVSTSNTSNPTQPKKVIRTIPAPAEVGPSTLLGPVISSNPSNEIVEETTITITPQEEAYKIYYKINNGLYKEYTEPFKVTENCYISSYYVSKEDGRTSLTNGYRVNNIKVARLPYVVIDANPDYLVTSIDSTEVSISGRDYNKLEFSYDGEVYQEYVSPLTITESKTIYARGTNEYGVTIEKLDIITKTPPLAKEKEELAVSIDADPADSDGLIAYTDITITYDSKAENKYYSIDGGFNYRKYTGPFRVTKNATIVGYAESENGAGKATKVVDYLSNGVANPKITTDPASIVSAYSVVVTIEYDKNAIVKQYKIGNGEYKDYTGPFEVSENTTITAYNKNILNEEATSYSKISNIIPEPRFTEVDLGDYYLLKLNYPDVSSDNSREYKWKENGIWKTYHENGFVILKQSAKDKYDLTADGIEITDTKGEKLKIKMEHVYVLDCPASELAENIFMRWDTVKPKTPEINLSTNEASKEVEVTITYAKQIVDKQYKIIYQDGTDTDWQEYTGKFKINKNNVTIYAKGKDRSDLKTDIASKKITNIDEEAPTISIKGDFETAKRSVPVQITAADNLLMYMVKWDKGRHDANYFNEEKEDNGHSIKNGSTVTLPENGIYTIYAVDSVGNETLKEIEIKNVDLTAPDMTINVLTSGITTQAKVSVDYGDSETKEYSIGDDANYQPYTEELLISSYDYYDKANEDGSLTIYVKGTDSAGNINVVSEKLYCLDLDMITAPVINASSGYPILTEYGVKFDNTLSVKYADRNDIINYICLKDCENEENWKIYTGSEHVESGTVQAKSVKPASGLTVLSSKTVSQPADALGAAAYDGNLTTYATLVKKKIYISSEMRGKQISYSYNAQTDNAKSYSFYDENNELIIKTNLTIVNVTTYLTITIDVPINAAYMTSSDVNNVVEIRPYNEPVLIIDKGYPLLTEYGVESGYNNVSISYFSTAKEKQYKVNDGEWQTYNGTIKLNIGEIVYARSIDKYGVSTPIVSYTAALPDDALDHKAYDGNLTTYATLVKKKIYISSEMRGKQISYSYHAQTDNTKSYSFYDENNELIIKTNLARVNATTYLTITIDVPINAAYMTSSDVNNIVEIRPYNEPVFIPDKVYPLLTEYGVEAGYNNVSISYFSTAKEKQYKVNDGEWQTYNGTIKINIGEIVYARSIDKYGVSTPIVSYTAALPDDALDPKAYDGNLTTYATLVKKKIYISSEMRGKQISYSYNAQTDNVKSYSFYDENNELIIKTNLTRVNATTYLTITIDVPINAVYMTSSDVNNAVEIKPANPISKLNDNNLNVTSKALRNAKSIMSANTVADSISEDVVNPIVNVESKDNTRVISIEKDENYKTEYSLDLGTTWIEYTEPFEVIENTTIFTRVVDNEEKILTSSTYTITSIKEKEEIKTEVKEESTEVLPSETSPEIVEKDNKEEGESDETNE